MSEALSTLLIVDDSKPVRCWIREQLEAQFKILEADCLEGGRKLLEENSVDLFILDNMLPDGKGVEWLARLREEPEFAGLPVIMVSGTTDDSVITKAIEAGATDFIRKPLNAFELHARVALTMRCRRADQHVNGLIKELEERTERDPLTDALNRFGFQRHAVKEIAKARRSRTPVSLMILDIDGFKQVNDTHGHPAGDEILVGFTNLLSENLRKYDLVCRHGGDEFVLVLPHTSERQAEAVAEKLLHAMRAQPQPTQKGAILITTSIGIVTFAERGEEVQWDDGGTLDHLLETADRALYLAKKQGRNCAVSEHLETGGVH